MLVLGGYKMMYAYIKITPTYNADTFNLCATLGTVSSVVLKHAKNENHKKVIICTITIYIKVFLTVGVTTRVNLSLPGTAFSYRC